MRKYFKSKMTDNRASNSSSNSNNNYLSSPPAGLVRLPSITPTKNSKNSLSISAPESSFPNQSSLTNETLQSSLSQPNPVSQSGRTPPRNSQGPTTLSPLPYSPNVPHFEGVNGMKIVNHLTNNALPPSNQPSILVKSQSRRALTRPKSRSFREVAGLIASSKRSLDPTIIRRLNIENVELKQNISDLTTKIESLEKTARSVNEQNAQLRELVTKMLDKVPANLRDQFSIPEPIQVNDIAPPKPHVWRILPGTPSKDGHTTIVIEPPEGEQTVQVEIASELQNQVITQNNNTETLHSNGNNNNNNNTNNNINGLNSRPNSRSSRPGTREGMVHTPETKIRQERLAKNIDLFKGIVIALTKTGIILSPSGPIELLSTIRNTASMPSLTKEAVVGEILSKEGVGEIKGGAKSNPSEVLSVL